MKYRDEDGDFQDLYFKTGDTLPIGTIVAYGSLTPPTNWLVCDGSAVSRTAYAALFAAIGTSYGSGDGSTTFNLPDLRGRVPVGKSTDTEFDTLGETGGEKTHTLTVNEMPSHTHKFGYRTGIDVITSAPYVEGEIMGHQPENKYTETSHAGGGQAHNILQPYQVVCFIIKAEDAAGVVANVTNTQSDSTKDTYSCDYINGIIESSSNANGNYVKFADGTMVCYGDIEVEADAGVASITLPMPFLNDAYSISITNAYYYSLILLWSVSDYSTTGFKAWVRTLNSMIPDVTAASKYIAIGKWK